MRCRFLDSFGVFGRVNVTVDVVPFLTATPASAGLIYSRALKRLMAKRCLSCIRIGRLLDDLGCHQAVNKEEVSCVEQSGRRVGK